MKHIFEKGTDQQKPTFLLLHGTGGTEQDLFPIAERLDPLANKLGVRGNVLENGMPRFFRRIREGVFDEEDLIYRTNELNEFLNDAAEKYDFDRNNLIAIGYSNGANIAASLLFHFQDALKGAVLHHPMVPRRGIELPNLTGKEVLITAGTNDPLCPAKETEELSTLLKEAQATVEVYWENQGHQLTPSEVETAKDWYVKRF